MNDNTISPKELKELISEEQRQFSYKDNQETVLLRRLALSISEGDSEAWEDLYKLLYDPLVAFINRLVRSQEDASDISQDVFVNLWLNHSSIDPKQNIKGYIYGIARNLSFRHIRERSKDYASSLDDVPSINLEEYSPEDIMRADEISILISLTLDRMPPQRRKVFELSRYNGLNNDQIADKLEISIRTVESHIYQAKKEIREAVQFAVLLIAGLWGM